MNLRDLLAKIWREIPMKGKYGLFILIGILIGLLSQVSCSSIKNFMTHYPKDNFVEQIVEEVIENETGIVVDLSP